MSIPKVLLVVGLSLSAAAIGCSKGEKVTTLRNTPGSLTEGDVERMLRDKRFSNPAEQPDPGFGVSRIIGSFQHSYEPRTLAGSKVVIDYATALMWQQSGSANEMTYFEATEYVAQINQEKYAGFTDWRLPTVEELASLMEPSGTSTGLHIDPRFDRRQNGCWSSDRYAGPLDAVWYVTFDPPGRISGFRTDGKAYVKAVRSHSGRRTEM